MKASVQYNDFVGTVAADGVDPSNARILKELFEDTEVDMERYQPVGFDFHPYRGDLCDFKIVCLDTETNSLVKFGYADKWTFEEFFNLFKRFHIVGINSFAKAKIEGLEVVPETIWIDTKE